jgi:hypothetical protein
MSSCCVLSRIKKTRLFWTVYAKWCKLSKCTNPECCGLFKCRLYLFGRRKKNFGVFCIRVIFSILLLSFYLMSSSFESLQEKKMGVFCHREIIITVYCFKSINRFSTAGCFVIGIYLNWVISYYLIVQSRFSKGHFDLGYSGTGLFYTC